MDKDFCLSSYIALRYVYKDDIDFFCDIKHQNYVLSTREELTFVDTADEIDEAIRGVFERVNSNYDKVGILLSGGMDSAILASYLKPGSCAYTFTSQDSDIYNADIERAKKYCDKYNIALNYVDISFDDYKRIAPIVMRKKGAPVHSIEPQIYKAAMQAKNDGIEIMIIGDAADYIFGGMDKLLSKDWTFDEFVERYVLLEPEKVLVNPVNITSAFEPYRQGKNIDYIGFLAGPTTIESYGSYNNAFEAAEMEYIDPYERLAMRTPMDLQRIRNGESKYLIRELYAKKYPDISIPTKIPMPRPVDMIFENWEGPIRREFRKDISMKELTGNQKWQLWCAEQFLNMYED